MIKLWNEVLAWKISARNGKNKPRKLSFVMEYFNSWQATKFSKRAPISSHRVQSQR